MQAGRFPIPSQLTTDWQGILGEMLFAFGMLFGTFKSYYEYDCICILPIHQEAQG